MININLNETEKKIFNLLVSQPTVSLDEVLSLENKSKWAIASRKKRSSMIVRMKYLAAKLAPEGWIIENESGIGRGAKAVYKMVKKF